MITNAEEGQILSSCPLLGGVELHRLQQLAFASDRFVFADGATLLERADEGADGFLILSGEVELWGQVEGEPRLLATLGAGFLAGEGALVRGDGYRMTVRAKGRVETLRLRRPAFLALFDGDPDAMDGMLRYLGQRKEQLKSELGIELE